VTPSSPSGRRPHPGLVLGGLALLAGVVLFLGVSQGPVPIPWTQIVQDLLGLQNNPIINDLRLPRVLASLLVGADLGISGALYQGLFRNPLADPYLMGSASGAAFGVTLSVSLAGGLASAYSTSEIFRFLPRSVGLWAFVGALGAVGLALLLAGGSRRTLNLVLAGVVVGSILTGLTTYLMLRDANRFFSVLSYTLGDLAFVGWRGVRDLALYLILPIPLFWPLGRALNAIALGEETARSLGLPLERLKLFMIALASLLTASSVAQAGIIGFVGLIAPHLLRRLIGGDYRLLLPASALGGAILLGLSDLLARILVAPAELPVGVVTTLLGGPFFLYLLWRSR
jgi:iron complex transport system permease protein